MKISGLQKVSLVDFNEFIATTIFTPGCNFLCPFCHNASLVRNEEPNIDESEIWEYLEKRKNIIKAVCISGGEPTLQKDLPEFISRLKEKGYKVKLDTNGSNIGMVKYLVENHLIDYIAMDIKNSLEKYPQTIGTPLSFSLKDSINYIMNCGIDYEFRTTIIKEFHTENDIRKICEMIKHAKRFYLQKFKDSGNCINSTGLNEIDYNTAMHFKDIAEKYVDFVDVRGY